MDLQYPFDGVLAEIDPQTHCLTRQELQAGASDSINVTVLAIWPMPIAIDLTVHHHEGCFWLTCPRPLPIMIAGIGLREDGTVEPYVLAAEPCRCRRGPHNRDRWDPLGLALVWHEELPRTLGKIVQAYRANLLERYDQYCVYGLAQLAAPRA